MDDLVLFCPSKVSHKSCLPQSNQPPTSPNPNPNSNPLDQNILEVEASSSDSGNFNIAITDVITQKINYR